MIYWIIIALAALAYMLGGVFMYGLLDDYKGSKWERLWLSVFWIVLIPLWLIHWIHMKF